MLLSVRPVCLSVCLSPILRLTWIRHRAPLLVMMQHCLARGEGLSSRPSGRYICCSWANDQVDFSAVSTSICARQYFTRKLYSVSQKKSPLRGPDIFHFFHKRLRIFSRFFTHLLYVPIYARLQIFIQLSPILTKLCRITRDYTQFT